MLKQHQAVVGQFQMEAQSRGLAYQQGRLNNINTPLHCMSGLGPPHVLWQVSFGCWVMWSISSWQKCYKSVFFFNFTKLQFLNNKIYSYTKNNYLALGNLVFWSISSFKTKSKHLSQFFWWEVNLRELRGFILQKIWALVAGRQKKKFCPWSLDLGRKKLL